MRLSWVWVYFALLFGSFFFPWVEAESGSAVFEEPVLLVENHEGGFAPFVLYGPLRVSSVAGSGAALIWTEKRLSRGPFEIELLGKILGPNGWSEDRYLTTLSDQALPGAIALWMESASRLHVVYSAASQGQNELLERLLDQNLQTVARRVLDRSTEELSMISLVPSGSAGGICYRRGSEILFRSLDTSAKPVSLFQEARPSHLAMVGGDRTVFVAMAHARKDDLRKDLRSRIEIVELLDGHEVNRGTVAEPPGTVAGLALAISSSGKVAVAWADDRFSVRQLPSTEIFCRIRQTDGTWLSETRLTTWLGDSLEPLLTWDPQERLHLIWQDNREGSWEVYHKISGSQETDAISSRDGIHSVTPSAAWIGGRLTVVWRDGIEGRADLYLSREATE